MITWRPLVLAALAVVLLPLQPAAQLPGDPKGVVPPPPAGAPAPPPAPRGGEVLTPPPAPDYDKTINATIDRFHPQYTAKQSPRLAVYWNRTLSDRLSVWVTERRIVATGQFAVMGERQGGTGGDVTGKLAGSAERTLSDQRLERDARRPAPTELWGLEFENGFLDPLLRAGANVVDRATILRLTAAKTTGTGVGSAGMPDEQAIEVRALQGYADLLVEILVSPAPQAPGGYVINAQVKNIANGQIMAHVNSTGLPAAGGTRQYVATSRGFELQQYPPELRRIASDLSLAVMDALANYWRRR